jgi:Domain of unknown function (DUF4268)/CBS domain
MSSIVQHLIPESQTPDSLVTVSEETSIQDVLERMIEFEFSQLPVVDQDFKLKGLITSDSIFSAVSYFQITLDKIKVSHATFKPKTCRPDDDLSELLNGLKSPEFPEITRISFSFSRKSRFRIELYIDLGEQHRNKLISDTLQSHKLEIEDKLGESLSWERLGDKRASRVALYHENASITDPPEKLMRLQDWAVKMTVRFYKAIAPRLHEAINLSQD